MFGGHLRSKNVASLQREELMGCDILIGSAISDGRHQCPYRKRDHKGRDPYDELFMQQRPSRRSSSLADMVVAIVGGLWCGGVALSAL